MNVLHLNDISLLQFGLFPSAKLFHFSTTIRGGVSNGNYESLNLGFYSGDDPLHVFQNRFRLAEAIGADIKSFFIPYQTHTDQIRIIDDAFLALPENERLEQLNNIDALITNRKNICIGVTTADCVPVLIFDSRKEVLAAVHAGWKGTTSRIVAKTVDTMVEQFGSNPSDLLAGIAPCISPEMFEVGDEVGEAFSKTGFDLSAISFRNPNTEKLHIDLRIANESQLLDRGVLPANIEVSESCTYSDPDKFFSARRQTIHSGRMITGGMIYG